MPPTTDGLRLCSLERKKGDFNLFSFKEGKSNSFGFFLQIGVIGLGMVGNALVKNLKREGWVELFDIRLLKENILHILCTNLLIIYPDHRYNVTSILDTDTSKYKIFHLI